MTAFEVDGRLFQYCQLPFGVANGVSVLQRVMDDFIKCHKRKKVYAYLDDLTVTGATKEEYQKNLQPMAYLGFPRPGANSVLAPPPSPFMAAWM